MALSEAVESIAKMLVKNPDEVSVQISQFESEDAQELEQLEISLQVHPDDRGRIIGRRGKTINALRTLIKAAAIKQQQRVNIEVVDN
ncbi:MAG: KH domain-containing protein [Candidatus Sericytochromatia bacterium]|nr:KH domain-containing protein [Candidatus Sericytochromatia bacterium]